MDPKKSVKSIKKKLPQGKKQLKFKIKVNLWTIVLGFAILFFIFPIFLTALQMGSSSNKVDISQLVGDIKEGKVNKVVVENSKLIVTYNDGSTKFSTKEDSQNLTDLLEKSGIDPSSINYTIADQSVSRAFGDILSVVLPLGLMAAFFFFIMKAQNKGAQDIFSMGRSRAKLFAKGKQNVTFNDVAGVDDAKKELMEVVDFLRNPGKYRKIGARTPKGVLLFGPAGVGKTLLARAVAGEAGVPFFSMAGSEFMEMLVGVGASVTGDTPILVKKDGNVKMVEIGDFVDSYYKTGKAGTVKVGGIETLGLKKEVNGFWGSKSAKRPVFGGSKWQSVESVFRHKVKDIYEIEFLGGKLKTTGDHSVFVREQGGIREKETRDLKPGDVLVSLPMNTRAWKPLEKKTLHTIKKHEFPKKAPEMFLDIWQDDQAEVDKYEYVMAMRGYMSQYAIAEQVGVAQATVGNWQNEIHISRPLSKKSVKLDLPDKVKASPSLMRLFGYYTAEGRGTGRLEFTFNLNEQDLVEDVVWLMDEVFGLSKPKIEITDTNTARIIYYSAHLGRFFGKHCGLGSHNKHVPSLLWDLPREYFIEYLRGYWCGDGYETKSGKLSMTSVSHRLIRELSWLCSMHGIKVGVKHEILKSGRIIDKKALPEGEIWTLIIGKTSSPFKENLYPYQFKRAVVRSVKKKKYDDYVYDLCGVEQEAFFGGETPILLHNSRVRDLFSQAKNSAPSIIFIDEVDAIGRQRGKGFIGGHDEREQTLNQILVEMDGFTPNDAVLVIAATNRGDLLDPALLRPGRFDRRVILDMPDKEGRESILKIHARGKKFARGIGWAAVADRTVGFSGADLENMLNEAAIIAAVDNKNEIGAKDIEEAATKVKLGPAKKRLQTDEDRRLTACHEAGHAVVTHFLAKTDPVQRISIVARGMSLGHTLIPPTDNRTHETKSRVIEQISAMLGGRAAENVVFNEMTSGAASDISQATKLARAMVVEWGMGKLGPINLGSDIGMGDFGQMEWYDQAKVSPAMMERIDNEVKEILDEGYKKAEALVKKHRGLLEKVIEALLKKETLEKQDFEKIVGKKENGKDG